MTYYDTLETRDPAVREAELLRALPAQIAHAQRHSPAFARLLADVDAALVTSRDALARLPVTRKSELLDLQHQQRPFGSFTTVVPGELARIFQSPGPLFEPGTDGETDRRCPAPGPGRLLGNRRGRAVQVMRLTYSGFFNCALYQALTSRLWDDQHVSHTNAESGCRVVSQQSVLRYSFRFCDIHC